MDVGDWLVGIWFVREKHIVGATCLIDVQVVGVAKKRGVR